MMLGRPEHVEAKIGGKPSQTDLLLPYLVIWTVVPAVAGEHHHHPDVHARSLPAWRTRGTIFAQRSTQHVVRHATWWRKRAAWQAPCGNETDARAPTS